MSVAPWTSAESWDIYLRTVEHILDDRLVRLDDRDPVRRPADTASSQGKFIVDFEKSHDRRWVSGKFEKSKVTFSIDTYREPVDAYGQPTRNHMTVILPQETDLGKIKELFDFGNAHVSPFYSYADLQPIITEKGKRHQRLTSGFDIERELPGVFWLTFFGPAYTQFFGTERLSSLTQAQMLDGGGTTIRLGASPGLLTFEREQAENGVGPQSFAGHGLLKQEGEFALTLAALRDAS